VNAARGHVLVRPVETDERYAGGHVIIPDSAREKLTALQVEIVDVGPDALCEDDECERPHDPGEDGRGRPVRFHPFAVPIGAWVLIAPYTQVPLDEEAKLWVVRQEDVVAVLAP
jgi:co-chaperonin GroES (HSP10)